MSTHAHTLPEAVTLAATEWLVKLQAIDQADARTRNTTLDAWQRWHDAHPQHAQAWQRLSAFTEQLRTIPPTIAHGALVKRHAAARQSRRRVLGLFALASVAGAAWTARDSETIRVARADYSTAVGERRTVRLDDGTLLSLNTQTAVNVRYSDGQRNILLERGEIAVTTGADKAHGHRPFFVETAHGRLQALGTRFVVRQHETATDVTVLESAVRIQPGSPHATPVILNAGQSARFDRDGIASRTDDANAATAAAAWTQGMLVVHAMPLATFLHELGRYRRGHLGCAPEIASLPVSGIYPIDDTDRVLDMLARSLPVEIQRFTGWWVRLQPGPVKTAGLGRVHT